MRRFVRNAALARSTAGVVLAVALLLGLAVGSPPPAQGATTFDILAVTTNNTLLRFSSATPGTLAGSMTISGLPAGEAIVGIDVRPANGQFYALGGSGRLYTIDPTTGAATRAGTATLNLSGDVFGFDFNPVADRLRVGSDGEKN
jgi:hypothetical protein